LIQPRPPIGERVAVRHTAKSRGTQKKAKKNDSKQKRKESEMSSCVTASRGEQPS
jgi:hypothetical protein